MDKFPHEEVFPEFDDFEVSIEKGITGRSSNANPWHVQGKVGDVRFVLVSVAGVYALKTSVITYFREDFREGNVIFQENLPITSWSSYKHTHLMIRKSVKLFKEIAAFG